MNEDQVAVRFAAGKGLLAYSPVGFLLLNMPHSTVWKEPGTAWSIAATIDGRLFRMIGS
jgi:hypothetical protein